MKKNRLFFENTAFRRGVFSLEINTSFQAEAFTVILGPSGCGKTTLLDLAAGFLAPDSGRILKGNQDVTNLPPEKRSVGVVFQDHALFPHMSVRGNVAYGPRSHGFSRKDAATIADRFLEMTHLTHLADRNPSSLSGGERQRVALSRALAIEPDILLLDEPFSSLDASLRVSLRREVKRIQEETGITAVLVTHDQEEALGIADDLAVMRGGRIVEQSAPKDLWRNPTDLFTALFLGRASRLSVERYNKDKNGGLTAVTSAGPIPLPSETAPPPLPAVAVFRPEDLVPAPNGYLTALVKECEYSGGMWKVRLIPPETREGDVLEMDCPSGAVFPAKGETLRMNLDSKEVRILPDETTDRK